ncbi:MAG: phosphoribosylformylglycinamidine synthase, purS protein [Candidatus Hecatellales archaeon]|nr:MAG: phosphoribosylformylglycinamidine synthase, purS protein [Candidatus Hecatellales archaeon]
MKTYIVEVIIENKPAARDPEGETIHRDLILKGGYVNVRSVRTGKYLRMLIDANSPEEAEKLAFEMCNTLRIYNPVAHVYRIRVEE